jgi:nitroimidazol reductase NimA-like FMN-containing flavoprotein (pyridoxamine 5'-phosphate oxidase superfamily)
VDELTQDEIERFLDGQTVGRLGCHDAGVTYVVPLIYAREARALYVLTTEGEKIRVLRKNPGVCFEVDEYESATGSWRSVIVQGRYEELDAEGKSRALSVLSKRFGTRRGQDDGPPPPARPVVAFRIHIDSATGRAVRRSKA